MLLWQSKQSATGYGLRKKMTVYEQAMVGSQ
jgi:hypothetical protein